MLREKSRPPKPATPQNLTQIKRRRGTFVSPFFLFFIGDSDEEFHAG